MSGVAAGATSLRSWGRAMPTLLRVGMAECLAYRAEFIIWLLTTTLPLIMLGLWTSVASDGPFANFLGRIDEVNAERRTLKVMVEIFERMTTIEVEFWQIEQV